MDRLLQRTGNPLNWHPADKCLIPTVLGVFFALWYWLVLWYLRGNPQVAPYVDHVFLGVSLRVTGGFAVAGLIVIAAALIMRGRVSDCRGLVGATLLFYVSGICWGSYLLGPHTSLFSGLGVLGGAAIGWALFDRRSMTWAIALLLLGLTVMTLAEQARLIPYAPLLATAPFQGGRLATSWLIGVGLATFVMMLWVVALIYFVIDRWHDREEKLVATSEQLVRANDLISRYVASQLAEQIKDGNYDLLDHHARRKLTLFFSDIEGFAAAADRVEPEDLSSVLNEYLSEMTAIGKQHEATIDKFVGDAIMIFFGAPVATSDRDHALRAVRMAMMMQGRMVALRAKWLADGFEHPFHIRIGINTGQASIGNFGSQERMDYTAIGRQVNLAARLQAHCEPDRILLSHSTWVLVQDVIACAPKGEIQVKGLQQPVSVYEVSEPSEPV